MNVSGGNLENHGKCVMTIFFLNVKKVHAVATSTVPHSLKLSDSFQKILRVQKGHVNLKSAYVFARLA